MRHILSLVSFICCLQSFSQEANIWYFGNGAGLDFSRGHPKPLLNGEIYTNEGCAVACDNLGKLLFYTDGVNVWNRFHKTMAEGNGLAGNKSSTQSAVIVPKVRTNNQYYIFTISDQANPPGLCYSIVDVTANNGQGKVISKNNKLLFPVTEKLAIIKHCNGEDTWLITHEWNSNAFYSYLVSKDGISKPVISKEGLIHKSYGDTKNAESIGCLKPSPDGKKIAITINKISFSNIQLFDFNKETGIISFPKSLSVEGNAYGLSFSPDNSKLYVTFDAGPVGLVQFDLDAEDIRNSKVDIAKGKDGRFGAMQTGPDQRIYVATASPYLDVINHPNKSGQNCAYSAKAISLLGRYSTFGLPSFSEHLFGSTNLNLGRDTVVCDNQFKIQANIFKNDIVWSTGEKGPSIYAKKSGLYWASYQQGPCTTIDSIRVTLNQTGKLIIDLGKDTSVCDEVYVLDAKNSGGKYLWSTGETSQKVKITETGKYTVLVSNETCSMSDSIDIKFKAKPIFIPVTEFIPNNGGFNETFDYIIDNIDNFDLKIKNKRGKTVFQSEDPKVKWKGYFKDKIVDTGTYYWVLEYKNNCLGSKTFKLEGEVSISSYKR